MISDREMAQNSFAQHGQNDEQPIHQYLSSRYHISNPFTFKENPRRPKIKQTRKE